MFIISANLACILLAVLALANLSNATGGNEKTPLKEVAKEESEQGLRILLMIPVFDFNRSHVNFAVAKFRVLREVHKDNVDFVLPYFVDADIEYLKNSVEPELYDKMQFYKLMKPGKEVKKVEGKQEEATKKSDKGKEKQAAQQAAMAPQKEKPFEEMTTLGEILAYPDFGARMAYFPYIWIDMIENGYFKGKHYDVGIAEVSHPSQYAFAVFDALRIKHLIVSRAYSPSAMNYADLGLLPSLIDGGIPPVERTNIGDHLSHHVSGEGSERKKEISDDYYDAVEGATKALTNIDKNVFDHLKEKLPTFRQCMAKGQPTLREMFRQATYFLVNTQPELEYDRGKLLMGQGNGQKVKMIGGIHLNTENYGTTEKKPKDKNFIDKNPANQDGIEKVRQKMKTFEGYVLISFGSVVDTKLEWPKMFVQMEAILSTIRRMPKYLFIWQLTKGDPMIEEVNRNSKVPNVFATDWVDQQGILANPSTVAFISHCGKNSFHESLFHGIPPICVPNFGDQFYNAETGAKHGYGTVLDFYCIELNVRPLWLPKKMQQFTIPYYKSSGTTQLLPLPEKFHNKTSGMKQREFYKLNKVPTEEGEDRIVSVPANNNKFCFNEKNIRAAIDEAILAKNGKNGKGTIKSEKLHEFQGKLRGHNPHKLLLEAMEQIAQMEGKKHKKPMVKMETGTKHELDDHSVAEGSHAKEGEK